MLIVICFVNCGFGYISDCVGSLSARHADADFTVTHASTHARITVTDAARVAAADARSGRKRRRHYGSHGTLDDSRDGSYDNVIFHGKSHSLILAF